MAKRGKAPKRKTVKVNIAAKDFRYPGEARMYWQGVLAVIFVFAWLAIALYATVKTEAGTPRFDLAAESLAWPVVAVALCNILSTRPRQRDFKKRDQQSRVMSTNFPELYKVLQDYAKLAGMKRVPDMYLLDEERAFMFTMPVKGGTIVATRGLREAVTPDEFAALMAHEMGHIIARHVRTELAIVYVIGANVALKVALVPVLLMSLMMKGWLDAIDYSADRCAYLMTRGNLRLVNAAIVRQACAAAGKDCDVTMAELEKFLTTPGDLARDQSLLELQVRAGRFFNSVSNLRDRVEALQEFPKTQQALTAMDKLSQMPGAPL
jgi:Zn-dependent protease with chaperone function